MKGQRSTGAFTVPALRIRRGRGVGHAAVAVRHHVAPWRCSCARRCAASTSSPTSDGAGASPDMYYFHDGCRLVRPYWFRHKAQAKGHWVGQPLMNVLTSHFHRHPSTYYLEAIEAGRLTVNGLPASPHQLLAKHDVVHHDMHIHEPAVTTESIGIIHSSSDLVVVSKPAGLPCHEVSLYKYNTLKTILNLETGADTQSCVNRLDASVSGLVLYPQTEQKKEELHSAILENRVTKTYYARVRGKFPNEGLVCSEPLVQAQTGVSLVDHEKGRHSQTTFEFLSYDTASDTSIVKCMPHTGRRHQIRAHLRWLGYPIANDTLYGQEQLVPKRADFLHLKRGQDDDWHHMSDEDIIRVKASQPDKFVREQPHERDLDPNCWNCRKGLLYSYRPNRIWLHAYRYQGDGWHFTAPLPAWATTP